MSKGLRTIQQLQDELDGERIWRVKELSILRKKLMPIIQRSGAITESDLALLRPCITMIYGHWEGFVKAACSDYLEFVALQKMKHKEMQPQFLALAARKYANDRGAKGFDADRTMMHFYRDEAENRGSIPYKNGVDTKSNLWFDVFCEVYESLGLSWHAYELKRKMIDTKLVGKRNAIAHGQYIDVQAGDVDQLFDSIIELMDEIKNQLFDSAVNQKFKIATAPSN